MRTLISLGLFLAAAPAFAGQFKTLKIVNVQPRNSATPGLLDVAVTFEHDTCAEDYVGLETTIINTESPPRNPNIPIRGNSARMIRLRAVGESGIRVCASVVAFPVRKTQVIQIGAVDASKLSFDRVE
jgi:hypothetical protein